MSGLNSWVLNEAPLNSGEKALSVGSGTIVDIEQEIELHNSVSATSIADVEQEVNNVASSQSIVDLEQIVRSAAVQNSFYDKNDWELVAALGGYNIPTNQYQDVEVIHHAGDSARAVIKLLPGAGTYDLYTYQGKTVTISARTDNGFKRIFTGRVDIPEVDLIGEFIVLKCVSDRDTLIRSLQPIAPQIGTYSDTIMGDKVDELQEINLRLETIPFDLDFDGANIYSLTSWTPKSTPDFTFTNSDVYRSDPAVRIESSKNVVNKININFDYLYQRLHQQSISYQWIADAVICDVLEDGFTMPTRSMIKSAADSAGWYTENFSFTNIWPSGWYDCSGTKIGWVNSTARFSTLSTTSIDANGNPVRNTQINSINSNNNLLARGATWRALKRFTQNVQETYSLTVEAPQSKSLYSTKEQTLSYSLQSDFDPAQWENINKIKSSFSGVKTTSATDINTYYINKDNNRGELNQAILTVLNKAKTQILNSHRDSEIRFEKFLDPYIDLKHTIRLNTNRIDEKGKVKKIVHKMSSNGRGVTEITLALYRSTGSQSETIIQTPSNPTDAVPTDPPSVALGSRWGEDPSQPFAVNWDGYVGNRWINEQLSGFSFGGPATNRKYTNYPESFIVDTPSVSQALRKTRKLSTSNTYNIEIPNDNLSVIFIDSETK